MPTEVRETFFENGLKVLTRELHNAPVATFWVWYRVGSRNEVLGITGAAHWVEHMMFKGTQTLGKGDVFKLVTRNGGTNNAFTWLDYTAYYETLPSDRLEIAIQIESDRMVNARFDPDEVASERTVIISEREGHENDPGFWLAEEMQATAYKVHPYHHETIGWKADLQRMTRDDLYSFYKKYYAPNNATVVAVGDFNTEELLAKLHETFGKLPRGEEIPALTIDEPEQAGERRVTVRRPGAAPYFMAAYKSPRATDPDFYPTMMLAGVLAGASGLAMGRTSPGRSSRLYKALVDKSLTADVGVFYRPMLDPYLFQVSATVRPGVTLEKVERAVLAELDKIASKPITDREYEKVLKQTRAQYVYAEDGVANHGYRLGMLDVVASWRMYETFLGNLEKVTKDDVQRAAKKYLSEMNRTIGWFVPTNNQAASGNGSGKMKAARSKTATAKQKAGNKSENSRHKNRSSK
ncbi:MAG: insulinase family protein [Anaerolineae bacterium]|nr:insulinase family protein [Anaerolineae bacterium]